MTTPFQAASRQRALAPAPDDPKKEEQLQNKSQAELRQLCKDQRLRSVGSLSKAAMIKLLLSSYGQKDNIAKENVAKENVAKEEQAGTKRKMEHEGSTDKSVPRPFRLYKAEISEDPTPKCPGCDASLANKTPQVHTDACKAKFFKKFQERGDSRVSGMSDTWTSMKNTATPSRAPTRKPDIGDVAQNTGKDSKEGVPTEVAAPKECIAPKAAAPDDALASHCQCGVAFQEEAMFCMKCGSKRPPAAISTDKSLQEAGNSHAILKREPPPTPSRSTATTRRPAPRGIQMRHLQKAMAGREAEQTPVLKTPMKAAISRGTKPVLKTPMKSMAGARRKSTSKSSRSSGNQVTQSGGKVIATKQEVSADADVKVTKAFKLDGQASEIDIAQGLKGKVKTINSDGHALISFDGFESEVLVFKENFGNLEVMCKDDACKIDDENVWWKCPKCTYTIPMSVPDTARKGRKQSHILFGKCTHSGVALRQNFKSRSRLLRSIWEGYMKQTKGGLTKDDLCVSWHGKIVPKKRSSHSKKMAVKTGWAANWRHWCRAHKAIRQEHGITSFFKVKKDGNDEEKKMYMKILERSASSYAASINEELQKGGSGKQLTLASFKSPIAKEDASSPPANAKEKADQVAEVTQCTDEQ